MTNKKSFLAGLLAISAAFIITSCGSEGDSNVGQGGPDISPEVYTDSGAPAVDTTNAALIGSATPEEGAGTFPVCGPSWPETEMSVKKK